MRAQASRMARGSPSYFRRLSEQSDEGTPRVPPDSRRQTRFLVPFCRAQKGTRLRGRTPRL